MIQFSSNNGSALNGADTVASFQLENSSVRGRVTKLGDASIDSILKRHDYPAWAAQILGEALALAVMVAATVKVAGRIMVQAEGDGPIKLLVAEARTDGGVRGYVRLNDEKWAALVENHQEVAPSVPELIGEGVMGLVIVQDQEGTTPYQGVVSIEGNTLAECAQTYFNQSEQIPTRVRLAVKQVEEIGGTVRWRAGGMIIQQVASDKARGDTNDEWDTARAYFDTLSDEELTSESLPSADLLYRLFHEEGVRLELPSQLLDSCSCSAQRLTSVLAGMPKEEVIDMAKDEGEVVADCQFCGRIYHLPLGDILKYI
ncbi:Hsp33 family molecular chaperone HslO [Hirschia litorea]|uniref:Hsp33 family molecular chaperone HslO n=1 Tax=Hirschia litorea TaxID=1199156 RepID=A0ABW2ILT7_9PROT